MKTLKFFALIFAFLALNAYPHDHSKHEELETKKITFNGDSIFNIDSHWIDIQGKHTMLKSLSGKPFLAAMIYTTCTGACPMIVQDMKKLAKNLKEKNKLNLVLFSFDPERDTSKVMRKYADTHKLDMQNWRLLTPMNEGGARELANVFGVQYKKAGDDFIHSNVIFLIDENGVILAKKDGLNTKSETFEKEILKVIK